MRYWALFHWLLLDRWWNVQAEGNGLHLQNRSITKGSKCKEKRLCMLHNFLQRVCMDCRDDILHIDISTCESSDDLSKERRHFSLPIQFFWCSFHITVVLAFPNICLNHNFRREQSTLVQPMVSPWQAHSWSIVRAETMVHKYLKETVRRGWNERVHKKAVDPIVYIWMDWKIRKVSDS